MQQLVHFGVLKGVRGPRGGYTLARERRHITIGQVVRAIGQTDPDEDEDPGEVIPPDDRRMIYQLANMLWHSDSSFKPVPSLCSLLSGRIIPPEGGATELASTRAGYQALPEALKERLATAVAVHDFSWSRDQVRPGFFTDTERAEFPPVSHPVVRTNPVNGRKALFLGAHASHLEGLPVPEGRALLAELLEQVTRPEFRYRHEWQAGDLVIWDNRCVLHRATPYDTARHQRLMQRTTVSGDPFETGGALSQAAGRAQGAQT
jgi:alpha-ketoglutarate-dependent 2,4-dichlorophenoxyacetate dioxygenase